MKVLVTASERFIMTPDGNLWTSKGSLAYSALWSGYLEVYDRVHLMARAKLEPTPPENWVKATGEGIAAIPVPYFVGPSEYLKNYWKVQDVVHQAVSQVDALQLRVPCTIGAAVADSLSSRRPFGVEVVADPYDTFAPGSVRHPLRPLFRWWFPKKLRQRCAIATAALYVTKEALQRRYPCPNYAVGVSDVEIPEEMLVSTPRPLNLDKHTFTLIHVGTLAQLYKAPDVLIDAVAICIKEGLDLKLLIVGDGQYRGLLEQQVSSLGVSDRIQFCGQLPSREAVFQQLDRADLFILPSHQEGLPKAMVEAMARALPCIGSTVGGIPELLPLEDLVPPGNAIALAAKIREMVTNPQRMFQTSARNLTVAQSYTYEILHSQRIAFYRYVREQTEKWLLNQK